VVVRTGNVVVSFKKRQRLLVLFPDSLRPPKEQNIIETSSPLVALVQAVIVAMKMALY
jgi:hypothetical protein